MNRDPMRRLAWALIIAGVVLAVVGAIALSVLAHHAERSARQLDTANLPFSPFDQLRRLDLLEHRQELAARRTWALGLGAGMLAFGVLLLAIRRPERAAS